MDLKNFHSWHIEQDGIVQKNITNNYISIIKFKKIELAWINVANSFFKAAQFFCSHLNCHN